jgi:hypothetical protein
MFQRAAAAAPLSMRSSVQHHARPFNNKQRHQRAPASISMTRRRHHVVSASFSVSDITGPVNDTVNDLKSTEVRNFPQLLYIFFVVLGRENYDSFSSFCFFRRSIERDARKTTFFFNSTKRPPHPHPPARAFERRRKKGKEKKKKKKKKKTTVWRRRGFDSI